jgi:hypothetical protein
MNHSWPKNAFWDVNNKKWSKWCKVVSPFLFNSSYGVSVLTEATKCPNQVFYDDWSIYRPFVQNRGWKRDSFQIKIFVYVCWTWSLVDLKTRFETWITRNEVNGVGLFHLSYLTTLMAYLCSQRTPNAQNLYFMFDWSIYRQFVIIGDGNVTLSK